jgi:hypothetical protein
MHSRDSCFVSPVAHAYAPLAVSWQWPRALMIFQKRLIAFFSCAVTLPSYLFITFFSTPFMPFLPQIPDPFVTILPLFYKASCCTRARGGTHTTRHTITQHTYREFLSDPRTVSQQQAQSLELYTQARALSHRTTRTRAPSTHATHAVRCAAFATRSRGVVCWGVGGC